MLCTITSTVCCIMLDLKFSHVTFFPRQVYQVLPLPTEQSASCPLHEGLKAFARKMWVGVGKRGACEDALVLERVGSVVCHPEIRA